MKRLWKKSVALLCTAAAAIQIMPLHAAAFEPEQIQIIAIGDDCLVPTEGGSAADILASYYGGTAVNRAEVGMKAGELLSDLQTDSTLQNEIKQSDVILVSIGVNDLISPILYENKDIIDGSQYGTLAELTNALTREGAFLIDTKLSNIMPGVVEKTAQNVTAAVKKVRQLNPCANIVMQTVNNPLAVDFDVMRNEWGISNNRTAAVGELYKYLNVYLQGGTTIGGTNIPVGLNQTIQSLPNVKAADFYEPYIGASGEYSMGLILSDIEHLNMQFKPVGQVLLAAAAIEADPLLSEGNGSVIANAYAATGQQEFMTSERASMHQMIQKCTGSTLKTYEMGDAYLDGKIDMLDAYYTLLENSTISAGGNTSYSPAHRKAIDADGDGLIGMYDAYLWLYYSSLKSAGADIDVDSFLKEYAGR